MSEKYYVGAVGVHARMDYVKGTVEEALRDAIEKVRADGQERCVVKVIRIVRRVQPVEVIEVE